MKQTGKRITIRVSEELHRELTERAKADQRSLNVYVARLLQQIVDAPKP